MIKWDIGDKVVIVRADNIKREFSSEFQNKYKDNRIQFKPCPVYKHSLNGVSERAIYITDYKI